MECWPLNELEVRDGRQAVRESPPNIGSEQPPPGRQRRGRQLLDLWTDRRIGLVAALALAAGFGLISGRLTPRGPITTSEALISMGAALLIGIAAGLVLGNRWSMLVTPVVFAVVFEFTRLGLEGPTVDAINLGGMYG